MDKKPEAKALLFFYSLVPKAGTRPANSHFH